MLRILILLAVTTAAAGSAFAQRQDVRVTRPTSPREGMDSSTSARYQLASEYMRGGQFERAIALLEDLYKEHPANPVFFQRLKEAYENVKRYEDAIDLIDEMLAAGTQDRPTLRVDQARLFFLAGQIDEANARWNAVLEASRGAESTYRLVYNSMLKVRLLDQAIEVLLRGRQENMHGLIFQPELAHLYGLTGQHEAAMQEYLGLLEISARQINYVRGRLSRVVEQDGALEAAIAVTGRHVAENPANPSTRDLLSWLYTEAGNYEAAYTHIVALDQLNGSDGQAIYQFAHRAAEGGDFAIARVAFEAVQAEHPDTPLAADAQLGIGRMRELQAASVGRADSRAHFEAAITSYEAFLATHPDHADAADAMVRLGTLYQDELQDLEKAGELFAAVERRFAGQAVAQHARLKLGRLALEQGDMEVASDFFIRLASEIPVTAFVANARLEIALMHFYQGDFELADQALAILSEETQEEVANNALSLRLLILENPAQDSVRTALRAYALTAMKLRQRREAEVITGADDLLSKWGQHPIADDMRFLRAQAFRQADQVHDALAAFGELPLLHPESPYADRSLFIYAQILELDLQEPSAAADAYTELLTRYPGSLYVNEAREKIRTLRNAGV